MQLVDGYEGGRFGAPMIGSIISKVAEIEGSKQKVLDGNCGIKRNSLMSVLPTSKSVGLGAKCTLVDIKQTRNTLDVSVEQCSKTTAL